MCFIEARGRRPRLPPLSRRARTAHLRQRVEGSVGAVGGASDYADQRKSAHADRAQSSSVPGQGDGEVFLWGRVGEAEGVCAEVELDDCSATKVRETLTMLDEREQGR